MEGIYGILKSGYFYLNRIIILLIYSRSKIVLVKEALSSKDFCVLDLWHYNEALKFYVNLETTLCANCLRMVRK